MRKRAKRVRTCGFTREGVKRESREGQEGVKALAHMRGPTWRKRAKQVRTCGFTKVYSLNVN
jgi:hypothetical protein